MTAAELALRFAVRQAQLPHCRCGARVPAGDTECSSSRPRRCAAPKQPRARRGENTTPEYRAFCAEKRARTLNGISYSPKQCARLGCGRLFTPTGPRSLYCGGCR